MKIFIFEDEFLIATSLKQHLLNLGYKDIFIANNLKKANEIINTNYPDIAILDIRTPEDKEAGIKVAKQLNKIKTIPLIFMTAYHDDEIIEKALGTNCQAYLSKSFNQKIILRTIESAIENLAKTKKAGVEKNDFNSSYFFNTDGYIVIRKKKSNFEIVEIKDILYVYAEKGTIEIVTEENHYVLSSTLNAFSKQIDYNKLKKVGRNYIVNISHIKGFKDNNYIEIASKEIRVTNTEYNKILGLFKVLKTKS